MGCCLWGRTESDTTEATQQQQQQIDQQTQGNTFLKKYKKEYFPNLKSLFFQMGRMYCRPNTNTFLKSNICQSMVKFQNTRTGVQQTFFFLGPGSKYFRLCMPYSLPTTLFYCSTKTTMKEKESEVAPVMSDSLRPHGLQPTMLLCPQDFPGKSTGVGYHFLLQGIFSTQGSNLGLLHCRQTLLPSEPPGKMDNHGPHINE